MYTGGSFLDGAVSGRMGRDERARRQRGGRRSCVFVRVSDRVNREMTSPPRGCRRAWGTFVLLAALAVLPNLRAQTASPATEANSQQPSDLQQAEQHWRAVTRRNPNSAEAFANLGVVLAKEQKYAEAVAAYGRAIALKPNLPGLQLDLGLAEFKRGHFEAAIPPLQAELKANPGDMQATTLLGLSFYGAKRYAEAAKYLAVAADSDPTNTELLQTVAQSCLQAKDYSCAMQEFEKLDQLDPDSWAVHELTGEALDGMERGDDAVAEFQKAISLAPRQPELHFMLGHQYWKARRFDDAVAAFNDELAIDPDSPQSLTFLGDIAMQQGDYDKALPLLRKAIQLQNDIRLAYLDLGAILMEQKKYPAALAALRRAVELDPNQPDAHFRIGRIDQLLGDNADAQKEFAKVRELREKESQDLAERAREHLATGNQ